MQRRNRHAGSIVWAALVVAMTYGGAAMADSGNPLEALEVGAYSELAGRPNPEKLKLVPIPSLAAILVAAERKKGAPLTKAEVEAIRDKSTVLASPVGSPAVDDRRGYEDIDPSKCWEQWQLLRARLTDTRAPKP
jgi:hypothetical protein